MTDVAQEFSEALDRTVTYVDVPMAKLHRANRYDRATADVERITGKRPLTVEEFVAARKDFYLG
ncbi:hypothetical protein [Amycolatopsis vastitatis]|uniref:hypothetical protein n=1 Tax=Amycolatopsis vastitatis TaxID=1905142 RepID=UPI00196B6075|nr:hypothetical protein [Amycolatopsis vastitatis]